MTFSTSDSFTNSFLNALTDGLEVQPMLFIKSSHPESIELFGYKSICGNPHSGTFPLYQDK